VVEHARFASNDPDKVGPGFDAWCHVIRPPSTLPDDDGLEMAKTFHTELVEEWIWPTIQMLKLTAEALPIEVPSLAAKIRVHPELGGMDVQGSTLAICQKLLQDLGFRWDPIPLYQHTTGDFLMYENVQFSGVPWADVGLGLTCPEGIEAGTVCRVEVPRIITSPHDCWYREAEIRAVQG
jgi:hypothetical protein